MSQTAKMNASIQGLKGALQENAGWAIGNEEMQAEGAAIHEKACEDYTEALQQGYRDGMKEALAGAVQETWGKLVGDSKLQAEGKAAVASGEAKKAANSDALLPKY